ncbi:hypothetical protein BASA60_000002 [Batrachochytrium salamandrivorans]|nr:hypothetical protein BASA60_000002 [Batrachochytrium salamandrivorans]
MQVKQLQQHTATTTRAAILLVASAALLASSGVAASWQRRVYHTDSACKGPFGYGVQVWIPTAPCQAPGSVTASCEIKSTDTRTPSSEGTACDNNPASDSAYFPTPAEASLVSGANYLSVNVYNNQPGQANCFFDASVQVEQTTFAADGKCYAFEAGNYFKASCSATTGQVQFCNDAECKDCKPGGMVFTDTSCKAGTTLPNSHDLHWIQHHSSTYSYQLYNLSSSSSSSSSTHFSAFYECHGPSCVWPVHSQRITRRRKGS